MSRGAGRIQREIAAAFDCEPDNAFTTDDLISRCYAGINRPERRHRSAVLRAASGLLAREPWMRALSSENLGRQRVYFNRFSVLSYGVARLKAEAAYQYGANDERLNVTAIEDPTAPYGLRVVPGRPPHRKTEDQLAAMLAPGGAKHELVVPGGWWWKHVALWIAERDGDHALVSELNAEREAGLAALRRAAS